MSYWKTCTKCKKFKNLNEYSKCGNNDQCNNCSWYTLLKTSRFLPKNYKKCTKCQKFKYILGFNKNNQKYRKHICNNCLENSCKLVIKMIRKSFPSEYKECEKCKKTKKIDQFSQKKNKYIKICSICEILKEINFIEQRKKYDKTYRKNNLHLGRHQAAMKRSRKKQATPSWLTKFDIDYIKNIYLQAQVLTEITNTKYEVDHIIPLKGKTVSGLHVPWNLRVITKHENNKKRNKLINFCSA